MEITGVRAEFLDVNCYAAAAEQGSEATRDCLLVDAGFDCAEQLAALLADLEWNPVAVLLTHGHPDHVLGLPKLMRTFPQLRAVLGAPDMHRLEDPTASLPGEFAAIISTMTGQWSAPAAEPAAGGQRFEIAGLQIEAVAAPGHTEGSMLWHVTDASGPFSELERPEVLFTGDVLFAGSIGRTDLPGGDDAAMRESLALFGEMADMPVLPGHGPASTVAHELRTNPFL